MKIERVEVVPAFEPIVITIESIDELRWMLAIANVSVTQAREQTRNQGFELRADAHLEQLSLWNLIKQYKDSVK